MVKIEYSPDPTKTEIECSKHETVADFLRSSGFTREELIDLRFFKADLLGEEIDTSDGSFIHISEGEVCVTHDSKIPRTAETWIPLIISAIVSVAAVLIIGTPGVPDVGSRKQVSATNSLGESTNDPAELGTRIDDIFGKVTKHTPKLWQLPYRIGVNNQEVEVLLTCIGRGQYEHDDNRVFDGDTPYNRIPNAAVNFYGPGTYPGNGSPYSQIGDLITDEIGIYRQPNDLNPSELLPPNDLDVDVITWRITTTDNGDGTYSVEFFGSNAESEGIDLTEYFAVGEQVDIRSMYRTITTGSVTLYTPPSESRNFTTVEQIDLSGVQVVDTLDNERFTFTTSNSDWDGLVSYTPIKTIRSCNNDYPTGSPDYLEFKTLDVEVSFDDYYSRSDFTPESRITVRVSDQYLSIGQITNNLVGPVVVSKDVETLLFNFTSASGFFKLSSNTEVAINAEVEVFIDELDGNGDVIPGSEQVHVFDYNSNPGNVRFSVYQTNRIDVSSVNNDIRIFSRRKTIRDKNSKISNNDKIEWTSIYTFESLPDGHDFGDVTLAHWYVPSNSQSRLTKQRKSNLDVTRKITPYLGNGQFGAPESLATDDFSQIMVHTALDPWIGRLEFDQINADGFLNLKQQVVDYFGDEDMTRFGYDFDNTEVSFQDTFKLICDVVNCIPYVQFGVYDAFFERRQDSSVRQITHRNKIPGSETRKENYFMKYDGIELSYRDQDSSVNETIYIPEDRSATNPDRRELPGCFTKLQAFRRAYRDYQKQAHQYIQVDFDTDDFGKLIIPGARIDSPDGTRFTKREGVEDGYRVYDGEIVEVRGLTVELSQPVEFTEGEDHYIQFTKSDGTNGSVIQVTPGEDEFTVVMTEIPEEPLYDGYERDKTKFTFCSEQLRDAIALIPRAMSSKIDEGKEVFSFTNINYTHRYYDGDTEYPQ
ncbi:TM helix containing protein [Vibrio phage Artemius]|nr:TM helix containing protein [Vibrio phage Artemius]